MGRAEDLPDDAALLAERAEAVLRRMDAAGLKLATAESCTGGLVASLVTDIEGLSSSFERGFVTYTEDAKCELLGIARALIDKHSAVSEPVARAMAEGAIAHSKADLAVAITGYAGPAGPHDEPGLVHLAVARRDGPTIHRECHFGSIGRESVRLLAAQGALELLERAVG